MHYSGFKSRFAAFIIVFLTGLTPFASASASTYTYVGSWQVSDGPSWGTNPSVYTGQEAAALLFGGVATDYAISTVSSNPLDINFSTWLDGWGDPNTYYNSGNPASHDFSVDLTGLGYNGCNEPGQVISCGQSAYSAYVSDHGVSGVNYAFTVNPVPVPAAVWLFGTALIGFVGLSRRRKVA